MLVPFKIGEDWEAVDVQPRWVPIRHNIEKKTMTCAFCDLRSEKRCPYILAWRCHYQTSLRALLFTNSGNPARPTRILTEAALENTSKIDPDFRERRPVRSYRSIDPISCGEAIRFDDCFYPLAKPGINTRKTDAYIVRAPLICPKCSAPQLDSSRTLFEQGVLSSTHGPVPMRVEPYRCSQPACYHFIYEEIRCQHIVSYSFLTAATHAFMRREIQAVCLSSATITTRFQSYLRNNIEDGYAGLRSETGMYRTLRSLSNFFALALQLMIIDPPKQLFNCRSCRSNEGISRICVDGIAAGFDFDKMRSLAIISEKCEGIPPQSQRECSIRQHTGFLIRDAVGKVLIQATKSKKNFISERNLGPALQALYFLCPDIIEDRSGAELLLRIRRGNMESSASSMQ